MQGADALERAHRIRTIVFDKTGTLTRGRPVVTDYKLFDEQVILALQPPICLCFFSEPGEVEEFDARYCTHRVLEPAKNVPQVTLEEVLELAAALEVQSEHPLASAIVAFAAQRLGHGDNDKGRLFLSLPRPLAKQHLSCRGINCPKRAT